MKITIKTMLKTTLKTTLKWVKNYKFIIKKEMSFLKISDPTERDAMVKEYLDLKKNIRDNLLSERTGEQQLQTDLSKFFKPITETQKATMREITEELKPIKEGIKKLPQAITFPAYPSIEASEKEIQTFGEVATNALFNFAEKKGADKTFGIYAANKIFYIGDKPIVIKDNNIIVGDEEYEGTPGFWQLIMLNTPEDFTKDDYGNYAKLLINTNSLHRNNNPNNPYPKSSKGYKWNKILKPIWDNREEYEGSGVIVIPSDPNALLERLDLLLSSQEAGHTGVGNKLVSICDELKRQGVIDTDTYKKIKLLY